MRSHASKYSIGLKFVSAVAMSAMGVSLMGHVSAAEKGIRALTGALASGDVSESARGEVATPGIIQAGNNDAVPESHRSKYPQLSYPESAANPAGGTQGVTAIDAEPKYLPEAEQPAAHEPDRTQEVVGLRSEYRATYKNDAGSLTTEISATPLNYQDEKGEWQRVAPKLTEAGPGKRTSTGDSVRTTVVDKSTTGEPEALVELKPDTRIRLGAAEVVANQKVAPAESSAATSGPADEPTTSSTRVSAPKTPDTNEPDAATKTAASPGHPQSNSPSPGGTTGSGQPRAAAAQSAPSSTEAPRARQGGHEGAAESKLDTEFDVVPGGVQQTVTFGSIPRESTLVVPFAAEGLKATQPGERIFLLDDEGETVGAVHSVTLTDQQGEKTVAKVLLKSGASGSKPRLQVDLPAAWMAAEARAYPVRMSLAVKRSASTTAVTVSKNYAVPADKELHVGNRRGVPFAGYLGFPKVSQELKGHRIFGVRLAIADYQAATCTPQTIRVHKVNEAWSAEDSKLRLPGPSYDSSPLGSVTTSHGYIARGKTKSKCPLKGLTSVDLGGRGRDLVQGWVYGKANHGLTLRADESDRRSWKVIAGTTTANPPRLFITHSPFHAEYNATRFTAPILQNRAGRILVQVTNRSAKAWGKDDFYLAYKVYDEKGSKLVREGRAADLTSDVPVGKTVELDAKVSQLPLGSYQVTLTMMRKNGESLEKYGVAPVRLGVTVSNLPPVVNRVNPANGSQLHSLSPQLWARATDLDGAPAGLQYHFTICEYVDEKEERNCFVSGWQRSHVWKVTPGQLAWHKTYRWTSQVKDSDGKVVTSPHSVFMTRVAQPTSRPEAVGASSSPFDAGSGALHSSAMDVQLAGPHGGIAVTRSYNSGDTRGKNAFGAGWVSNLDMKLVPEDSGSAVVSMANGAQVRFGRNSDGSYVSPSPTAMALRSEKSGGWTLRNNQGHRVVFDAAGRLVSIHPVVGKPLVFGYDGQGRNATSIRDEATGRQVSVGWKNGLVSALVVKSSSGDRHWKYDYEGDRLTGVTTPDGKRSTYDWVEGGQYGQTVLADRPESYWRLDDQHGKVITSAVGVNLGTDHAERVGIKFGKRGIAGGGKNYAADFNGLWHHGVLPNGLLNRSDELSVELWYRPNRVHTYQPLLSYQEGTFDAPGAKGVPILYVGKDGHLYGRFAGNGDSYAKSSHKVTDEWHHIVLTASGDRQKLYLDGKLVGEVQGTVEHDKLKGAVLGAVNATHDVPHGHKGKGYAFGRLDEVAVYMRPISDGTIREHYRVGSTKSYLLHRVSSAAGRTAVEAHYSDLTGRVARINDANGGQWQVSAPTYIGGKDNVKKTVVVHGPGERRWFYEFDGLNGRILREGAPAGQNLIRQARAAGEEPESAGGRCSNARREDLQFCAEVTSADGEKRTVTAGSRTTAIKAFSYLSDSRTLVIDPNSQMIEVVRDKRGNTIETKTCRDAAYTDCSTSYTVYGEGFSDPLDPRWNKPIQTLDGRARNPRDIRLATIREYTEWGALKSTKNPAKERSTTEFTNDKTPAVGGGNAPVGLPSLVVDEMGRKTTFEYDRVGNLRRLTEASGVVTEYDYNDLGQKVAQRVRSAEDKTPIETKFSYDLNGRVVEEIGPKHRDSVTGKEHQIRATLRHDDDGYVVETKMEDIVGDSPDRVSTRGFDAHGRMVWSKDGLGNQTTFEFDTSGNQVAVVDALGNRIEYTYSALGGVSQVRAVGAPGSDEKERYKVLRSVSYDAGGRRLLEFDAMGRGVKIHYNFDGTISKRERLSNKESERVVLDEMHYDKAGNVVKHIGKGGKEVTERKYDYSGRLVSTVLDPQGLRKEEKIEYLPGGNVGKVTVSQKWSNVPGRSAGDALVTEFGYDSLGRKIRQAVKAPGTHDRVLSWTYDSRGLVTSTVSARGNAPGANPDDFRTRYFYDALGKLTRTQLPKRTVQEAGGTPVAKQPVAKVGYNAYGEPVVTENAAGYRKTTVRDTVGQVTKVLLPRYKSPVGDDVVPEVTTKYDALGRVTEVRDAAGRVGRKEYDSLGRVVKSVAPAPNGKLAETIFGYNLAGQLENVTGPEGQRSKFAYDIESRLVESVVYETKPVKAALVSKNVYNKHGQLVKSVSPGGGEKSFTYDSLGQVTSVKDSFNVVRHFGYDSQGRHAYERDGKNHTTWQSFTTDGRLIRTEDKDASGKVVRGSDFVYDEAGNMLSSRTSGGKETTFEWDAAGALTKQREKVRKDAWIETSFGYDIRGKRTRYTDGRGNSTFYSYNSLGKIERIIEPKTAVHVAERDRSWVWSYTSGGQVKRFEKPGGVNQDFAYDASGNVSRVRAHGGGLSEAKKEFGYDKSGRLTWSRGPGGDDKFTYNDRGQLLTSNGPRGGAAFEFNEDGLLRKRHDAAGVAEFRWDRGRLRSMLDPISRKTLGYEYDQNGLLSQVNYPGGQVRQYGYDALDRLTSDRLTQGSTVVAGMEYGYDGDSNVTSRRSHGVGPVKAEEFRYDLASRLTLWKKDGVDTSYEWDAAGNRTRAGGQRATYDERNRLLTMGDTRFEYTPRGTMKSRVTKGQRKDYEFDAFDRLTKQDGWETAEYDSLDRMVSLNGKKSQFAGLSMDPVAVGERFYGRDVSGEAISTRSDKADRLLFTNAHGDVVGALDPHSMPNKLNDTRSYDPFGKVTSSKGVDAGIGFQADVTSASGMVNMGARWYDPSIGGFLSRDSAQYTAGASILANRYTYGAGNPVTMVDPDGHWPDWGGIKRGINRVGSGVMSWMQRKIASPVMSFMKRSWNYFMPRPGPSVKVAPAPRRPRHQNPGPSGGSRGGRGAGPRVVVAVSDSKGKWGATKSNGRPRGGHGGGSRTRMKQQQVRARAAAEARARQRQAHVNAVAGQRAAALHRPIPVSGELAAPLVLNSSQSQVHGGVLADQQFSRQKPWRERMKEATEQFVQEFLDGSETAWRHVKDFGHAAGRFARDNKGMFIGMGVTAAIVLGCTAAGVATAGAAAVACLVAAGAAGGGLGAGIDCPPGQSRAECATKGAVIGGIVGLIPGGGSFAGGLARRMAVGGALGGATSAGEELVQSGSVSGAGVGTGIALGFATAGRARRVSKPSHGGAASACGNSFTGGTGVVMADGSSRPIRDVRVGDMVRTVDEESGRDRGAVREVVSTISKRGVRKVVVLSLAVVAAGSAVTPAAAETAADSRSTTAVSVSSGGSAPGAKQPDAAKKPGKLAGSGAVKRVVLEPTANHPFFVVDGKRWVDAGELAVGDRVALAGGGVAQVESSVVESRFVRVHNLTVDRDHTFLVTQAGDAGGVKPKAGGVNPSTAVVTHNAICVISGVTVTVQAKPNWDALQRHHMEMKVDGFQEAIQYGEREVKKALVRERDRSEIVKFNNLNGHLRPPGNMHVDHRIDLQANGEDAMHNMDYLDGSVNTSFGSQLRHQLAHVPVGTRIICVRLCPGK